MAQDLSVAIRLEMQTAQGESSLKRFRAALDATLAKLRSPQGVAILKQLVAEVESGKKKLSEIPEQWRQDVQKIVQIGRGVRLLDDLGIKQSHAQIRESMAQVAQSFKALRRSGVLTQGELAQAASLARQKVEELAESMNGARTQGQRFGEAILRVQALFTAFAALATGNKVFALADAMAQLAGRMRLVEGSASAAQERLRELAAVADRARVPVQDVAEAYAKMAGSVRAAGGTTEQAVQLSEALALALKASGASAQEAGAVMRQFGQALQRGKLSGDEFVSVAENGGKVLDYLAKSLGVSRGRLAEMSQAGELTTDKLLKLSGSLDAIRQDAAQVPVTLSDAVTRVQNAFAQWAASSATVQTAMRSLVTILEVVARNMDAIVIAVGALGAAFVGSKLIGAITTLGPIVAGLATKLALLNPVVVGVGTALGVAAAALAVFSGRTGEAASAQDRLREATAALSQALTAVGQAAEVAQNALVERIKSAQTAAQEAIKSLLTESQAMAGLAAQATAEQTAELDRQMVLQKAVIEARYSAEGVKIEAIAALVRSIETQKAEAAAAGAAKQLAAIEAAYNAIKEKASLTGVDLDKIEKESLARRSEIWGGLAKAYKGSIDAMVAENTRLQAGITSLEQQERAWLEGSQARAREAGRAGMTELQAYSDRLREIQETQAKARDALIQGEFGRARELAQKAEELAAKIGGEVKGTIDGVSVTMLKQTDTLAAQRRVIEESQRIIAEAFGKQKEAAQSAIAENTKAIDGLQGQLAEAETQAKGLRNELSKEIRAQVDLDLSNFDRAIERIEGALEGLKAGASLKLKIDEAQAAIERFKADPKNTTLEMQARFKSEDAAAAVEPLRQALKAESVEIPAGLNTEAAKKSLDELAQAARALETESQHKVKTNVDSAKIEIMGLSGIETESTHTIRVRRVEERASGGLVGETPARFASGGLVGFPRLKGGLVPGTGNSDTVPRTLEAGAFVLRKAAVQKYGPLIAQLMAGVQRFARGGLASFSGPANSNTPSIFNAVVQKVIELTRQQAERAQRMLGAFADPSIVLNSVRLAELMANDARARYSRGSAAEKQAILEEWIERLKNLGGKVPELASVGRFARGGRASDTIPALLTPGEFVVRRDAVKRIGLGMLEAINNLKFPVRGYADGGLVRDGRARSDASRSPRARDLAGLAPVINITVSGVNDPEKIARQLAPHLARLNTLRGGVA